MSESLNLEGLDLKAVDKFFQATAENRLKCRLLEEQRWPAFLDDLAMIVRQGASLEEAVPLLRSHYKPVDPALLPPVPRDILEPERKKEERKKRRAPNRDVIQWVFDNIGNDRVEPEEAPSVGAWGLLLWVKMSPANLGEFYKSIWPRILPTKAQNDEFYGRHEANDDNLIEDIGSMIRDVGAELAEEDRASQGSPEGSAGESAFP